MKPTSYQVRKAGERGIPYCQAHLINCDKLKIYCDWESSAEGRLELFLEKYNLRLLKRDQREWMRK